jgi:hypothetical protein
MLRTALLIWFGFGGLAVLLMFGRAATAALADQGEAITPYAVAVLVLIGLLALSLAT